MKSVMFVFFVILTTTSIIFAEDRIVDFEVKSGLEIIGAKESPRVIFFLPPLEFKFHKKPMKSSYLINKSLIEEDLKGLIIEEVKDVSNVR